MGRDDDLYDTDQTLSGKPFSVTTTTTDFGRSNKYMIDMLETKPLPAESMFETDFHVDFSLLGRETKTNVGIKRKTNGDEDRSTPKDNLFPGVGRRLDGMKVVRYDECCFSVNQSMKKLKMTDDSKVEGDRKLKNKERLEFKPFRGKIYILG